MGDGTDAATAAAQADYNRRRAVAVPDAADATAQERSRTKDRADIKERREEPRRADKGDRKGDKKKGQDVRQGRTQRAADVSIALPPHSREKRRGLELP